MGKYNEELIKAGVMLDGGRTPCLFERQTNQIQRRPTYRDRWPIRETRELIAGYWLWRVRSMDEALEWLKRAPFDGRIRG